MPQNDWMSAHQGTRLGEMHLPGSHDAGTIAGHVDLTTFGTPGNAITQDLTITQQLNCGTRFFDLRLAAHGGQIVAHHTTAGQGAYGTTTINEIIRDADQWCRQNTSEVAIFRISHTAADTNAAALIRASATTSLHTGAGNLCTKTLAEITSSGGGLICILEEAKFGQQINQLAGIHGFTKYSSTGANDRGIATCGVYSKTHKLSEVIANGLKGSYAHNSSHAPENHDHLWQIYWQKTYLNPASRTGIRGGTHKPNTAHGAGQTIHGGTHAATEHMIRLMQGHQFPGEDYTVASTGNRFRKAKTKFSTVDFRAFMLPNIISYDFVNPATNAEIIALNDGNLQSHRDDSAGDEDGGRGAP